MAELIKTISRADIVAEQSAPKTTVVSRTSFLESSPFNYREEQQRDIHFARRGRKPTSYKIEPIEKQHVSLVKQHEERIQEARAPLLTDKNRIPLTQLKVKKDPDLGNKTTQLPDNNKQAKLTSARELMITRKHCQEEIQVTYNDPEARKAHIDFQYPENDKFTITKLKEQRRLAQRLENDKLLAKFQEQERVTYEALQDNFCTIDAGLHYCDKKNDLTFTKTQLRLAGMHEADLEKPAYAINLKQTQKERQKQIEDNQRIKTVQVEDLVRPTKSKLTQFSQQILAEKNPDWQLLRVKSIMQQDEDKPMYSCFSPDGYFREMMLPQVRSQGGNQRQIPQELRGMVRVMQLPIVGEESYVLNTDQTKIPGEVRVVTRPDLF